MLPPSPELLLSLSPTVLRELVSTFGPVPGLRPSASQLEIVRALFESKAPSRLARILALIGRFGTESGRRALVEAGRSTRDKRAKGWNDSPAADVAAKLAVEQATAKGEAKRVATRLFTLAAMRLERDLGEKPTYELLALGPIDAKGIEKAITRGLGGLVSQVWKHTCVDGTMRVAVLLRAPTSTRLALEGDAIVTRFERTIAVDLVRVYAQENKPARVSMTLSMPELLPEYAEALGLSLRPSSTLRPLHDLTPERLARVPLPPGLLSLTVIARRRRRPDGSRTETRAFDALDPALEGTEAQTGYIDRTTLRGRTKDRVIDAFLQLPHRLEISDESFAKLLREALDAVGLLDPGSMRDDARSLAPYEHGDWRWRIVVRDEGFEAMVAAKLLIRGLAIHVVTEEHRMHGAGYVVRDVPGDEETQYALAEDRSLGARLVEKKDRVTWRLDRAALADAMRRDLGATAVGRSLEIPVEGLIDLGVVTLPSGKLRFVYPMATPPKGWIAIAARMCGLGMTLVVLTPAGHRDEGTEGVLVIELSVEEQLGVHRLGGALRKAAEALGVGSEIEAWRARDEEIVIEAKTQKVWLVGVRVTLTEKPYRFLDYLARHPGSVTASAEVGAYVSSSGYPDVAARRTRAECEKQMKEAIEVAGGDVEIVGRVFVVEGRKGVRLGVRAKIV